MANKLLQLEDGTFVEVEVVGDEIQQISGGFAEKVDATLNRIKPVLIKTCQPIIAAVKELREDIEKAVVFVMGKHKTE